MAGPGKVQGKLCCFVRADQGAAPAKLQSTKQLEYLTLVETDKVAEVLLLAELSLYVQSSLTSVEADRVEQSVCTAHCSWQS